jgi:hypothetical protein
VENPVSSSLDLVNLKPTDEKLNSAQPAFKKLSQDMNGLTKEEQKTEKRAYAVFRNEASLDKAVQQLLKLGITGRRMLTYNCEQGNFLDHPEALIESKLGEGAIAGGLIGLVIGAICGFTGLVGFGEAAGLVAFQNPFEGFAVCVAFGLIGGVLGAMIGRLIPQYKVEAYETALPDGCILLIVKDVTGELMGSVRGDVEAQGGILVDSSRELKNLDEASFSNGFPSRRGLPQ